VRTEACTPPAPSLPWYHPGTTLVLSWYRGNYSQLSQNGTLGAAGLAQFHRSINTANNCFRPRSKGLEEISS
jgi:hypothetical protein